MRVPRSFVGGLLALIAVAACGGPDAVSQVKPGAAAATSSREAGAAPSAAPSTPTSARATSSASGRQPASPVSVLYEADWSVDLGGWSGSPDWAALRGELQCAGQDFSLEAGAVAPVDVDAVADFAVEAEIKLLRYTITNGSFGVMVRVQEDGSGYSAGHHVADDELVLRAQPGGRPTLDSQPFTADEEWHRYRIEVRGNELSAFVDGAPVLGATDNLFLTGKRVGLWSSGAQLSVRSFAVTEI